MEFLTLFLLGINIINKQYETLPQEYILKIKEEIEINTL